MKHFDVEPNSEEHKARRLGKFTASQTARVVTVKKHGLSSQAPHYMFHLIAERATGEPSEIEQYQTPWMERGTLMEDEAVKSYEFLTGSETTRGGFWTDDEENLGCSLDRCVASDGILEIKSPLLPRQIETALTGIGDEYTAQIQAQLYITERQWVDVYSYHPRLILDPVRVYRDEKFIADLDQILKVFIAEMLQRCEELQTRFGPFPWPGIAPPSAVLVSANDPLGVSDADVATIFAAQRRQQEQKNG